MRTHVGECVQWRQLLSYSHTGFPQPTTLLLDTTLHPNLQPTSLSPSSPGRMQVRSLLLLLALILVAAAAEAGKNKKGEGQGAGGGWGVEWGMLPCPAESTHSTFPHRKGKEGWLQVRGLALGTLCSQQ